LLRKPNININWGGLEIIALLSVVFCCYLAVRYAWQPPLDVHAFRQAQTALSAYWLTQQGFHWAYETPVAGAPWSIPFEFPIYQAIVACLSKVFGVSLDAAGRLTSFAFLFLIVFPARSITKKLELPTSVFVSFVAILFSMPLYVYWGRTFMIETTALFFGIAAMKYFIDYMLGNRTLPIALAFVAFATLGVLQKATTTLPMLAILSLAFAVVEARKARTGASPAVFKNLLAGGLLVLVPVAIGLAWVVYTDQVKMANPLGEHLTSSALSKWNWGTTAQKLSPELWTKVIWERLLRPNFGGVLGVFLLTLPFVTRPEGKTRLIALGALAMGIVPLFLFTNLHLVHDYYQTANAIFLAYGLAIALAMVVAPALGKYAGALMLMLVLASNYVALWDGYLPQIRNQFKHENRDYAVGKILQRELPVGMQFVAFGNDWSSTFSYMSGRKSLTAPGWFKHYNDVVAHPEKYVEPGRLGGVVSCTADNPKTRQLIDWAQQTGAWKIGESHGCLIITAAKKINEQSLKPAQCEGNIDIAEVRQGDGVIAIAGWTAATSGNGTIPDDVFLRIAGKDAAPVYVQAMKVPRPDVSAHLKTPDELDAGFSSIVPNTFKPGDYELAIIQHVGGQYHSCGQRKVIQVN
jgi:hypothetical protein